MKRKIEHEHCHKCQSQDLRYSSTMLFKTRVTCGSCGEVWCSGRTGKAQKRYAREVANEAD